MYGSTDEQKCPQELTMLRLEQAPCLQQLCVLRICSHALTEDMTDNMFRFAHSLEVEGKEQE
jgi:hypothetical protein